MPTTDNNDNHERFTRLLLDSEPVMLRAILVVVPNRADTRAIMQETAVALWRQFGTGSKRSRSYKPTIDTEGASHPGVGHGKTGAD